MISSNLRSLAKPLIAVADDDELIRTVLRFALEAHDYEVLEASSGAGAVALLQSHPIDVLILDIHFPGESFEQTWAAVTSARTAESTGESTAESSRTPRPAVILLSGDSCSPIVPHTGGVEFLRKPVELAEFQSTVARLLATVRNEDAP